MAKETLSGGKNGKPYSVDLGNPQKRFYLGHEQGEAEQRKGNLVKLWAFILEAHKTEWDEVSLMVAEAIRKGKPEIPVYPDSPEQDGFTYRNSIDAMQKAFGDIAGLPVKFVPVNPKMYGAMDELQQNFTWLSGVAREAKSNRSTVKVDAVIEAHKKWILATKLDIATKQPTEWAIRESQLMDFIARQFPDGMELRQLNYATIDQICTTLANRPNGKRSGLPISPKYASHALKGVRRLIKWASKNYAWKKPEDWLDATTKRIGVSDDEKAAMAQHVQRVTYTTEELLTLVGYAKPLERAMMLLALNTGFGAKEVATLRRDEWHGQKIQRVRRKTSIYGEWELWPETTEAMNAIPANATESKYVFANGKGAPLITATPSGRSNKIANHWTDLTKRIQQDQPAFRSLSFNKLRKTASSTIRRIAGGEIASVFLCHGETTSDTQLEVYASRDFGAVFQATRQYRDELDKAGLFQVAGIKAGRVSTPIGKVQQIQQLWQEGQKPEAIALATATSRATVYRHRPISQDAR